MNLKLLLVLTVIGIGIVFGESSTSKMYTIKLQKREIFKRFAKRNFENSLARKTGKELLKYGIKDILYVGTVLFGKPGRNFSVVFDTGSSDVWVPSSCMCRKLPEYCSNHSYYNPFKSQTYRKDGRRADIEYSAGAVSGVVGQELLSFAGLEVKNQLFIETFKLDSILEDSSFDGVFGLSFLNNSVIPADPPFYNMIKQRVVDKPVFSFYMNRNDQEESAVIFGGVDKRHYTGRFVFTRTISDIYWIISLDEIKVCNRRVVGQYYALVDSGTSLITGSPDAIDPINQAIGAPFNADYGLNTVNCEKQKTLPLVTFVVNNTPLTMRPEEYILTEQDDDTNTTVCFTAFNAVEPESTIVLGVFFMQTYYTLFDLGKLRVGFARAV